MDLYTQAWDSKFHPDYGRYAGEDSAAWQKRVVGIWLETLSWFERQRIGVDTGDWRAYCSASVSKGQGRSAWGGLRNLAITLRDFGPTELVRRPHWSMRYPRERLISALPLLLFHAEESGIPALAGALAVAPGTTWRDLAENFLRLWRRYA
jgi:hypothetical protein